MGATTLKGRRIELGLTLRDVEDITQGGVSNAYLSQLENGKIKAPSLAIARLISAAYALPLEDIAALLGQGPDISPIKTCPSCGQAVLS